jgi:COMPASS component SWD3
MFPSLSLEKAADNVAKIWSPFSGELIRNLNGHTKGLSDIAWSPNSVYLATASDDHTIRIWDVDSVCTCLNNKHETFAQPWFLWKGMTSKVLKGHTSYVFCVNYNTEGTQLVSGGCDGDVKIWNAAKGAHSLSSRGTHDL